MAKKGLGKGLNALFNNEIKDFSSSDTDTEIKISELEPNRNQPRKSFDEEKIELLAESIKEHGLIQPVVVSKNKNGMYTIVAGERRWRAAKKAGLKTIPVSVREYTKKQIAEISLIENLQREDLNAIEEAAGYKSLLDDFNLTQEEVSEIIGKSRSAVANSLRLLSLDEEIQKLVISGKLSGGHARTLISIPDKEMRLFLAHKIIDEELSVRQAENLAKLMQKQPKHKSKQKAKSNIQIELEALSSKLSEGFGTSVKIKNGSKKGKIEIEYYSNDDLSRIIAMFNI